MAVEVVVLPVALLAVDKQVVLKWVAGVEEVLQVV